jgi:hypothetical protein
VTGAHRGGTAPLRIRLWCWLIGHQIERIGLHRVRCSRCDRIAPSPVELP